MSTLLHTITRTQGIKVNMQYDPLTTVLTYKNVNQYLTIKSLIPPSVVTVTTTDPTNSNTSTANTNASSKNNGSATTPSMTKRRMTRRSSTADSSTTNTTYNAEFDVDSDNEDTDDYASLPSTAVNKSNKSTARGRPSMLNTSAKSATSTTSTASSAKNNADGNSGSADEGAKGSASEAVVANVKILDSWAEVEALGGADPSPIEMDPDMEGMYLTFIVPCGIVVSSAV